MSDKLAAAEAALATARREERERCAKLFDDFTYGQYAHPSEVIRALTDEEAK